MMRPRMTLALALTLAAGGAVPAAQAVTTQAPTSSNAPTITWKPCETTAENDPLKGLECGTMPAPLNHAYPEQGTITVAMARKKASNQAAKKGTVFLNPGGPGGSGREVVADFAAMLGPTITDSWDVVGVDPRGVGGTERFECTVNVPVLKAAPDFAWKSEQAALMQPAIEEVTTACGKSTNKVAYYMTTADTARDLDLARQAVGDEKLTYYGLSYGTFLGATYSQLFPEKVRALVLDSALDPAAWTGAPGVTVPTTSRIKSRLGAQAALTHAIAKCAEVGPTVCPDGAALQGKFDAVSARLRQGDLVQGEKTYTYSNLIWGVMQAFYDPRGVRHGLDLIRTLHQAVSSEGKPRRDALAAALRVQEQIRTTVTTRGIPTGPTSLLGSARLRADETTLTLPYPFPAVMCTDGINPKGLQAWKDNTPVVDAEAPGFGPAWLWNSGLCSAWPFKGQNPYRGPFTKATAHPVFVLNNEYDPATEVSGARALAATIPAARYLEIKGAFGHGSATTSTCARDAVVAYLNDTTLPDASLTCSQSVPLFPPPTSTN